MTRSEVEAQGRLLLRLRAEKESLAIQTEASRADKQRMIAGLPAKVKAEALSAAGNLLSRLSPGDSISPGDVHDLAVVVAGEGIVALLNEALAQADPGSHGAHDLAYLEKRRAELEAETARLAGELAFNAEGSPAWPSERIALAPKTLVPFDAWSTSSIPLRDWSEGRWLAELGPGPEPEEEPRRGPGRPRKILSGFRERENEEAPI